MQEEAAALQLLARELDGAATRTRDRFAKPVIERLAPYLQLVLPQARLVLGEDLAPQALERGRVRWRNWRASATARRSSWRCWCASPSRGCWPTTARRRR